MILSFFLTIARQSGDCFFAHGKVFKIYYSDSQFQIPKQLKIRYADKSKELKTSSARKF